jgi:hypothetical protein
MGDPDELRLRFGVSVVHDPTRPMSDQELLFGGVFTPPGRKAAEGAFRKGFFWSAWLERPR